MNEPHRRRMEAVVSKEGVSQVGTRRDLVRAMRGKTRAQLFHLISRWPGVVSFDLVEDNGMYTASMRGDGMVVSRKTPSAAMRALARLWAGRSAAANVALLTERGARSDGRQGAASLAPMEAQLSKEESMQNIYIGAKIRDSPVVGQLSRELGVSFVQAVGHLVNLWMWASAHVPDGMLVDIEAPDLAVGANWEGDPEVLWAAMVKHRFLTPPEDRDDSSRLDGQGMLFLNRP